MRIPLSNRLKNRQFVLYDDRKLDVVDQETTRFPLPVRRALAEKLLLRQVPIRILDGERIAGLRPVMSMPNYALEGEKEWAWNVARLTPDICYGHNSPNYWMVLEKGLSGLVAEIDGYQKTETDTEKRIYREAMKIAAQAVIEYAARYAEEAERLAGEEQDEKRRQELKELAGICRYVPANPPRSFHEALQSVWFTFSVLRITGHTLIQLGRFDQYMRPFFEKDIREGVATEADIRLLLEDFWIKCCMTDYLIPNQNAGVSPTNADMTENSMTVYRGTGTGEESGLQETGTNMILGGVNSEGVDATNRLSYLCLEIAGDLRTRDPIVSVRLHRNTPASFIIKACEVVSKGSDMPAFYNDEVVIPALEHVGVSAEDARNYCNDGCIEVYPQGKSQDRNIAIWVDSHKCLELALNNGMSYRRGITTQHIQVLRDIYATYLMDGEAQGPATGTPESFETFEQFFAALKAQIAFEAQRQIRLSIETDKYIDKIAPSPLASVMLEGCIASGKDHCAGGAKYNNTGTTLRGLPNTAEAVAAIKKLCFDERLISLAEMVDILKNNFKGRDDVRKLIAGCPKWGDNNDSIDGIMNDIAQAWFDEIDRHRNNRGGRFKAGLWSTANDHAGAIAGASADGRFAGEPTSTNLTPIHSNKGPTSYLNAAGKIDYSRCANSVSVDLHLMPDAVDTPEKQEKLAALIKAYFAMGGFSLALNVVNPQTLKQAQKRPDEHKDLLIRVHGYSAFFVTLSQEYQDLLIRRAGGEPDVHNTDNDA